MTRDHEHAYDANGKQICCTLEERVNAEAERLPGAATVMMFLPALFSTTLLGIALLADKVFPQPWFTGPVKLGCYLLAYLPVGFPVLKEAWEGVRKGEVFSEFLLMTLATLGAFAIGEYPEGVAVMLFYAIGEAVQTLAVKRAKANIKSLLDQRPDQVTILENDQPRSIKAHTAKIGDIIQLRAGEKLGLDGELVSDSASFNTSALTGESKPDSKAKGQAVLAGMINLGAVARVRVTTAYSDSKLSRILDLVQNAAGQKAPTELFIRKFAKVYTPIVVALAALIALGPYFFVTDYAFSEWLYRALVFLVVSCPCALVISIPLGYFGGIGAASRNGILIKGGNFLDVLASVQNVVMDKTGTLTEGVFQVQEAVFRPGFDQGKVLAWVNALEAQSTHPVATAIRQYAGEVDASVRLNDVEEISGHGLQATVEGERLLVGNFKLMDRFSIKYDIDPATLVHTLIAMAYGGKFAGYLTIADKIKPDARAAIDRLKAMNVKATMLSGDKENVVQLVAKALGIDRAFGDLLPEDKVEKLKEILARSETAAFVGDGVNDAPVVALSSVGMAMGGLGSDATIETADVVIQDDHPGKIPVAILIGRHTRKLVRQNIVLAFSVKAVVLVLGAGGLATMWEAVFADVGVALLAILNAARIQRRRF